MHITEFRLDDNFIPDIVTDPYRRKKVGVSICIKEGENMEDAKATAEQFIKEYIEKNTIIPHEHIVERYIPEELLPEIQVKKELPLGAGVSLEGHINSCKELKVLESYYMIVRNNPILKEIYDIKKQQLVDVEIKGIISKADALLPKQKKE